MPVQVKLQKKQEVEHEEKYVQENIRQQEIQSYASDNDELDDENAATATGSINETKRPRAIERTEAQQKIYRQHHQTDGLRKTHEAIRRGPRDSRRN